jgi:hypothetical protein
MSWNLRGTYRSSVPLALSQFGPWDQLLCSEERVGGIEVS